MSEQTIVRRGRPRLIRKDQQVAEQTPEVLTEAPTIKELPANRILGIRGGKEDIIPFRGVDDMKQNQSHFFVNGNPTNGYKLIRVYLDPKGRPKRALERTLKPRKRTIRGERDRAMLSKLKTLGISGII